MTTFIVVISTLNLLLGYALAVACQRWSQSAGAASSAASLDADVGVPSRPAAQPAGVESSASPAALPAGDDSPAAAEQHVAESVADIDGGESSKQGGMAPLLERMPVSLPNRLSSASAVPTAAAGAGAPTSDEMGLDLQRFREELVDLGRELRESLGSEADDEHKERLKQLSEGRASAELFESAADLLRPPASASAASTSVDEQRPETAAEAARSNGAATPGEEASAAAPLVES